MLKEQVFHILNETLSKIILKDDHISYKAILDSDIHPAIKNYFRAELRIVFSRDKALLKKKSVFNYSSKKIDFLFNQIFDELLKSTVINSEEFNNLLLQAISFNLSHLIKPNWSLKKLIFNDKKNINSSDFFLLLDYAYFFTYQRNVISKYFRKLDYNYIELENFDDVLIKIDRKLFKENKRELLLDFFHSALNFTDFSKNQTLSTDIVLTYLTEKGLNDELNKLKDYIEKNNKNKLGKVEFEEILFTPIYPSTNNLDIIENSINTFSIDEDYKEKLDEVSTSDLKEDYSDSPKKSKNDDNLSLFDDEPELEFESELESQFNFDDSNNDSIMIEGSNAINEEKKSASDFLQHLTEKEIQRIQENLFNSDSEDFIFFIEKLVSANTFDESIIKLNNLTNQYQIDQTSREINLLKNALEKFYKG